MIPSQTSESKPRILIVEDESMLLTVMAETLRDAGYDVSEADTGEAALAMLSGNPGIGVLISDVRMPGISGYQVAERAVSLRPAIKIIMMTGYAHDVAPAKHAKLPVLYKPFDFDRLPDIIESLIG